MRGILETLRALGPLGVFVLAILDSAGVPIVGGVDALLIWVTVTNPGVAYWAAGMAVAGSVIGSLILFSLARKGGQAYLNRYTLSSRGARLKTWFLEYGLLTVFVPAVIPIVPMPLKVFVLSAGALRVNPVVFAGVMCCGRFIRYFTIAWLGLQLGDATIPYLRNHIWQLVGIAVFLFVSLYFTIRRFDGRRKLRNQAATGLD